MRVIGVQAKDIFFKIELTLTEIMMLRDALNRGTFDVDGTDHDQVESNNFLTEEFYRFLDDIATKGETYGS